MSRLAFLLICLCTGLVYADMDCSLLGSKGILDKAINSNHCPGYLDSYEKGFCCVDADLSRVYCCNAEEFAIKTGLNFIVPILIAAAVIVGLVVCCISCFCCSCCPWYRRRHQGTVYGKVQAPIVQVVQPQPNLPPSYTNQPPAQTQYVPYPTNSTGMPQPAQPPPYTSEAYTKQAPYNPTYQPSQ